MDSPLRDFLLNVAVQNDKLAHSLHWHLELERTNESNKEMTKSFFNGVWEDLMEKLEDEKNEVYQGIVSGVKLKDRMLNCSNFVKNGFGNMKIDPKKR